MSLETSPWSLCDQFDFSQWVQQVDLIDFVHVVFVISHSALEQEWYTGPLFHGEGPGIRMRQSYHEILVSDIHLVKARAHSNDTLFYGKGMGVEPAMIEVLITIFWCTKVNMFVYVSQFVFLILGPTKLEFLFKWFIVMNGLWDGQLHVVPIFTLHFLVYIWISWTISWCNIFIQ